MTIHDSIIKALREANSPLSGRIVALRAELPYKVTVDALGRMLDASSVVRFGRKYSADMGAGGHGSGP